MLFMTTYKIKPFLSNEETKKLLEVFAKEGAGPGTTAHYVAADGSHGVVIADTDDVAGAYRNIAELHAVGRVRHQGDADGRGGRAAHHGGACLMRRVGDTGLTNGLRSAQPVDMSPPRGRANPGLGDQ